jgi:hypothetical protein
MSTAEELRKKLLDLANKPLKEQQEVSPLLKQEESLKEPTTNAKKLENVVSKNKFLPYDDYISPEEYRQYLDATTIPFEKKAEATRFSLGLTPPKKISELNTSQQKKLNEILEQRQALSNSIIQTVKKARLENNPNILLNTNTDAFELRKIDKYIEEKGLTDFIKSPLRKEMSNKTYKTLTPTEMKEAKSAAYLADWEKLLDITHDSNHPFFGRTRIHEAIGDSLMNDHGITNPEQIPTLFKEQKLLENVPLIQMDLKNPNIAGRYVITRTPEYPLGVIYLNTGFAGTAKKKLGTALHEYMHARDSLKNFDIQKPTELNPVFKALRPADHALESSQLNIQTAGKEGASILGTHHNEGYAEPLALKSLLHNKKLGAAGLLAMLASSAYSTGSKADEGDYEGVAKDIAENTADVGSLGFYSAAKKLGAGKSGKNILKDIAVSDRAGEPFDWSDYSKEDIDELHEGLKDTAHAAAYLTPAAPYVGAADTGMMLGQGAGLIKNLYKNYKNNQSVLDPEFEKQEEESKRAQEEWEARHKRVNETTGIERANKIKRSIEAKK